MSIAGWQCKQCKRDYSAYWLSGWCEECARAIGVNTDKVPPHEEMVAPSRLFNSKILVHGLRAIWDAKVNKP